MAGSRDAGVRSDVVREAVPSGAVQPAAAGAWGPVVGEVYSHHQDRLIGFLVRRIHDHAAAQDLAQDTIMRFAGALDRFDASRPVWPYLKAVAHNVLVDHVRGQARQVPMDTEEEFAEVPEPGEALDESVALGRVLDGAIERLPERQRVAIELRCARGWDVAEAAAFMGLDPAAFRQLLFRARGRLRTILAESGAQVHGVVVPVLVWARLRARAAADRVREVAQSPASVFGAEGLASVMVAAALGVAAVTVGVPDAGGRCPAGGPDGPGRPPPGGGSGVSNGLCRSCNPTG